MRAVSIRKTFWLNLFQNADEAIDVGLYYDW